MAYAIFYQPGPVPVPGQPGPGSTRRSEPGFKTLFKKQPIFCPYLQIQEYVLKMILFKKTVIFIFLNNLFNMLISKKKFKK
jgi:hypothetical protein